MRKPALYILLMLLILAIHESGYAVTFRHPRIGIVVSKTSLEKNWENTQMAAHAWSAIANLAGIPYDCLLIKDLVGHENLSKYSLLIFGQCTHISERIFPGLVETLGLYLNRGGNLLVEGPIGLYNEGAKQRNASELYSPLGIEFLGFRGNSEFRIKVIDVDSYITKPYKLGQFLTQHLSSGLKILNFKNQSSVLLVFSDSQIDYPFLSAREFNGNRVVLLNDLSTWSGVASFFRNKQPKGYYANQIYDILVRTIYWLIYGEINQPFPAPQLSNANLTAIIRLDADHSYHFARQAKTIEYLINLAKETGVVPVYGWVSSEATLAGWETLAPLGKELEDVGGQIGSHSKSHFFSRELNQQLAEEELDGSIEEIETNMDRSGCPIGNVEFFINPNVTIYMTDYEQIAKRFSLFMTHGFDQAIPLGYGNMTWFTGSYRNLAVINDSPASDWYWFRSPKWSYSTAEIVNYEEAIFDHMFHSVGRGVIFNQMWHDYSINSAKKKKSSFSKLLSLFSKKERIINENNLPLYDALKSKFATHDIYCPDPVDLGHKLRAMAQWKYEWSSGNNRLEMILDLSDVCLDTVANYTGGMGIRIENTYDKIQKVFINNNPHYAFNDQLVILPNLIKGKNKIELILGTQTSQEPHLTFISKRMPSIQKTKDHLETTILTKSKAKFSFYVEAPFILLNADWQEWNRKADQILNGFVTSNRTIILKRLVKHNFAISRSTVPIIDLDELKSNIVLTLGDNAGSKSEIHFTCSKLPKSVILSKQRLELHKLGKKFHITLPEYKYKEKIIISF